jgi:hypothetical protein
MKNIFKPVVLILFIGLTLLMQSCNKSEPGLSEVKLTMKATTALSTINSGGRVMNTATVDVDGIVRINNDSNADIANQIAANLSDVMRGG